MLTLQQATSGPWTLIVSQRTRVCTIRTTQCGADLRLYWHVTTPRGRGRGKHPRPSSHFVVLPLTADGVASTHPTLVEAVNAINALDQETAHG